MIKTCENCGNSYLGDLESCPYCGFTPNKDIPLAQRADRIARMKMRVADFFACCGYFIITVLCLIWVFFFLTAFSESIPYNPFTDIVFSILLTSFPFMVAYRTWLKRTSDYTSTRYVSGFLTIIFSSFPSLLLFFIDKNTSLGTSCESYIEIALPMLISLAVFRFIRYKNNSQTNKKPKFVRYIFENKTRIKKQKTMNDVKKARSIIMNICSVFALAPLFIYMFKDSLSVNAWFNLTAISFILCIVVMSCSSEETTGIAFLFMLALPLVTFGLFRGSQDWPFYLGYSIICLVDYFHLSYSHMQNKEATEEYSKKCKYLEERVNELEALLRKKEDK